MDYIQFGMYDNPQSKIADREYAKGDQVYADDANWLNERLTNIISQNGLPDKLLYFPIIQYPYINYDIPVKNSTGLTFGPYTVALPIEFNDIGEYTVTVPDGSLGVGGVYICLDESGLPPNGWGRGSFGVPYAYIQSDTGEYQKIVNEWIREGGPMRTVGPMPGNAVCSQNGYGFWPMKESLPNEPYQNPNDPNKNFVMLARSMVHQFPYSSAGSRLGFNSSVTIPFPDIVFPGAYWLRIAANPSFDSQTDYTQTAYVGVNAKHGDKLIAETEDLYFVGGTTVNWGGTGGSPTTVSSGCGLSGMLNMKAGDAKIDFEITGNPGAKWDLFATLTRIGGFWPSLEDE